MKRFVLLVVLLALALSGAWLWHFVASDPGYVLVALHGWSIETTLIVAIAFVLCAWILAWMLFAGLRLPLQFWSRRRRHVARERLAGGLVALHEGRWRRAEKLLCKAACEPQHRLPALLAAARAAQQRGDDERSKTLLAEAAQEHDPVSVALLAARQHQQRGEAGAITALFDPEPVTALPPRALDIYLSALVETGRAAEAVALLPSLRASRIHEGTALAGREAGLIAAALQQAPDVEALTTLWSGLARRQRHDSGIVDAYARRALALGEAEAGLQAIEKALRKQWSPRLVALYGLLPRSEDHSPLKKGEAWLAEHPDDPELLVTLGRLCRNEQLWGKANEYLQRALALGAGARAWEELGHVHALQHEPGPASVAYARALALQGDEGAQPVVMAGRNLRELIVDQATPETRTSMGVPLLEHDEDQPGFPLRG